VLDAFLVLIKQAGGASFVGFQLKNLYNRIEDYAKKSFDGSDTNSLVDFSRNDSMETIFIMILRLMKIVLWLGFFFGRDKQMLEDHKLFGDSVVFDTTFLTISMSDMT